MRRWLAVLAVGVAVYLLVHASPTRVSQPGTRWYDDDIYDEIASGPAD